MLEFWQNGKRIKIDAIEGNGRVGQMVIYGERTEFTNPVIAPLSQYTCPTIFTIVENVKDDEINDRYILRDPDGKQFQLKYFYDSSGAGLLYDAQEWLTWSAMHESEKISRKQRKIEQLEGHVELLKDILVKQGVRVVTEAQAKDVGL